MGCYRSPKGSLVEDGSPRPDGPSRGRPSPPPPFVWTRGGKRRELKRGSGQARAVAKTEHFNAHLLSSLLFLPLLFVSNFLRFAQSSPPLLFLPVPPISGGFNKDKTDTGLNQLHSCAFSSHTENSSYDLVTFQTKVIFNALF